MYSDRDLTSKRLQIPLGSSELKKLRILAAFDEESLAYYSQQILHEVINKRFEELFPDGIIKI